MDLPPPLVVFCHLRWDFVYQRPQHLMERLAKTRRVIFIEEPVHDAEHDSHWEFQESQGVKVCRPHTPIAEHGFADNQLEAMRPLIHQLIAEEDLAGCVLWFYSPLAWPLSAEFDAAAVIYDCMDELSAFLHAPAQLISREQDLLNHADLVFTGGPSLYASKRSRHIRVYCFSSSVDAPHFRQARDTQAEPADQEDIPHPRLGFYGVIDERFDLKLLDAVAAAREEWQFVIVGPIVKIDPASIPQRPNIHFLGQQSYAALPAYLSGWDVCLLPFARNEATRYISPTKTLEYMAAELPIVSTSIRDVAEPYGNIVAIADEPTEFVRACERALSQSNDERTAMIARMRDVLARTSWDQTVSEMAHLIDDVVAGRGLRLSPVSCAVASPAATAPAPMSSLSPATPAQPVVIIGGGPTGLSASYHLGEDTVLIEQHDSVGGWCRSVQVDGFTFDFAGHIMFSNDPYVHELYEKLLGDNVHWQDREAWVYSKGVHTRYPFQGSLYGLPPEVIKECLLGAIQARYGAEDSEPTTKGQSTNGHSAQNAAPARGVAGDAPTKTNGSPSIGPSTRAEATAGMSPGGPACSVRAAQPFAQRQSPAEQERVNDCCADGILESTVELAGKNGTSQASPAQRLSSPGAGLAPLQGAGGDEPRRSGFRGENAAAGVSRLPNELTAAQGNSTLPGSAKQSAASPPPAMPQQTHSNFEEFIYKVWGAGIAKHFAVPYNRKLWAVPLNEMETSWLGGRVPMPDLGDMIEGALRPSPKPMGPNARFGYPLRGGFQALVDGFLPLISGEMVLGARVVGVSPSRHTVRLSNGEEQRYDHVVSTMPLPLFVKAIGEEAPAEIHEAASGLRYVSVRCVNLGIGRERLTEKHWIYYPEDTVFHRIFVQGNASPHCNAPGGFGLTCEITYSPYKPLPCDGQELVDLCVRDCHRIGMFAPEDPVWTSVQCDMPFAYVVYDHGRAERVRVIREWLADHDIILAGRYSEWEYYNSDHAFLAGKKAAETVRQRQGVRSSTTEGVPYARS